MTIKFHVAHGDLSLQMNRIEQRRTESYRNRRHGWVCTVESGTEELHIHFETIETAIAFHFMMKQWIDSFEGEGVESLMENILAEIGGMGENERQVPIG
jgi:hypothetical protein